jgi:hypothetical protein
MATKRERLTGVQEKLLKCAKKCGLPRTATWQRLVKEVLHPRFTGQHQGKCFWHIFVPSPLVAIWDDLPVEGKVMVFLAGVTLKEVLPLP